MNGKDGMSEKIKRDNFKVIYGTKKMIQNDVKLNNFSKKRYEFSIKINFFKFELYKWFSIFY